MAKSNVTPQQLARQEEMAHLAKHKEELRMAAGEATKLISTAAAEAAKVVSDAATVAVRVLSVKSADDHDLLIELKTRMEGLKGDIQNLTTGVSTKLDSLERDKADRKEFEDLKNEIHGAREDRIRKLENKTSAYFITIGIYTLAVIGMITLIINHLIKA